MPPRRHDEEEQRELEVLLRNAAFVFLLALFAVIVIMVLLDPARGWDTTLLLGLATATITSALALIGVQAVISRRSS